MMESSICLLRCVIGKDVDVQCASHPISLLEPSLVPYTKKALNTVYNKYIFILQSPLPDSKLSEDRNCAQLFSLSYKLAQCLTYNKNSVQVWMNEWVGEWMERGKDRWMDGLMGW